MPSKTEILAAKVIFSALEILVKKGGDLPLRELLPEIEKNTQLDVWAKEILKSGHARWQSNLFLYSINLTKAGYLVKEKGRWYITVEGEAALKLGETDLFNKILELYDIWKKKNSQKLTDGIYDDNQSSKETIKVTQEQQIEATLEQIANQASEGIKRHIDFLNPYEFQDLVAALLRAMGYFTPYIAPKGKDGGVDIIAYQDPLGVKSPRIKVQVKHREVKSTVQEIRQLKGVLTSEDIGLFVSTGGFTSEAEFTARSESIHIELIDLDRLIELWQEFYTKLLDEDKEKLKLRPIYFFEP